MRWQTFQTLIHEYLHTVTHPNYTRVAAQIGGARESILIEGGTSLYTDEVWKAIFPARIKGDAPLRASVEGKPAGFDSTVIPTISHYAQIKDARAIEKIVAPDNFKAAYFQGKTEYIGFPTSAPAPASAASGGQFFDVPPTGVDTLADVAVFTGAKVEDIAALNPPRKVDATVRPGERLIVPGLP
jgi:hypothetical protein